MTDTAASMASERFEVKFAGDVGIAILDMNLRFVRVNDALAAINGAPADAHVGRTIPDVYAGVADGVLEPFRRVLDTGTPLENLEVRDEKLDEGGGHRRFSESAYRLHGADGTPVGLVVVVVEVTPHREALRAAEQARRQLLNERERLLAVFTSMPSGVAVADATTGEMVLANAQFEEIAGVGCPSGKHLSEMQARGFRPDGTAYE